ncbi:MAG: GHKL domain-containing protein [Saprospiraceae bacterium]|nr:GHKL domain-containing protein [Saprospiraceae bacterium]
MMIYKNFRILIVIRVLIIIVSAFLLVYLIENTEYLVSSGILILLIIIQIYGLVRYVDKTNQRLSHFLESIKYSDFTSSYSEKGKGKSFDKLNSAFNDVIQKFNLARSAEEEHFYYLQTVVQHVKIGILAYKRNGEVDLYNNAAKIIFKITNLKNINELGIIDPNLPELLLKLEAGDNHLYKLLIDNEIQQLSIFASEFRMKGEEYILISLQNIHSELEEKEIESWQKLIRVLTHEIMNSITPISSLASTVKELLADEDGSPSSLESIDSETIESVHEALKTIESRSLGLLNFVDVYRNLTRIPKPNFRYYKIKDLFNRVEQLLFPNVCEMKIDCKCEVYPEDLKLTADPDLLEQVLINLLINAFDAVKAVEKPIVRMRASVLPNGKICIEISDNGHGIKPDIIDKIFIPFFTSKKQGSGIGLSLSRQIMHLHKGKITVNSEADSGTIFRLTF